MGGGSDVIRVHPWVPAESVDDEYESPYAKQLRSLVVFGLFIIKFLKREPNRCSLLRYIEDDFITSEYKKTKDRGEMSRYIYDAQKAGKTFKMNAHHVPLRQMNHKKV